MYTVRTILVPTDFSEYSASAIEYARALSVMMKATIHLLHVIPEPQFGGTPEEKTSVAFRVAAAEKGMSAVIAEHVDEYTFVEHAIRHGQPAKEILRYAEEHDADLIVMATHGRTGLAHILMGSVAEKIVRHSVVPVMTVKPMEMIEPLMTIDDVEDALHLNEDASGASRTGDR